MTTLRAQIGKWHPIVGKDYRLLADDEVLQAGDETACVSLLLSLKFPEDWRAVDEDLGQTIAEWTKEDMDKDERLFRRHK